MKCRENWAYRKKVAYIIQQISNAWAYREKDICFANEDVMNWAE